MRKDCICGCAWEVPETEEVKVTGKLVSCPMCWETEEEEDLKSAEFAIEEKMRQLAESEEDEEESVPETEDVLVPEEDIKQKKPKLTKSTKSTKFTPEIVDRVKFFKNEKSNQEMVDMLSSDFGMNVSTNSVSNMMFVRGIKRDRNERKKYNERQFEFLRSNINIYKNAELHKIFISKFDIDITQAAMVQMMSENGIRRNMKSKIKIVPEPEQQEESEPKAEPEEEVEEECDEELGPQPRTYSDPEPLVAERYDPEKIERESKDKKKRKGMSEEVVEFIEKYYLELTDGELREKIADKFGAFHMVDKIEAYRETNGMIRPEGWTPDGFSDSEDKD